jgi:hypothetical protein
MASTFRQACIDAVSRHLGRNLTQGEARGIMEKVREGMRGAALRDIDAWRAMSQQQKLYEGARVAAEKIVAEARRARGWVQGDTAKHNRNMGYLERSVGAGMDPFEAVYRLFFVADDMKSEIVPLEAWARATADDYRRRLVETFKAVEPRLFGFVTNAKVAEDFVRELFGEPSGNPVARQAAIQWVIVAEQIANHYQDAGGVLHELSDWRFPQRHDQFKVQTAGVEKWIADVMPKLNRSRYTEDGRPLTDDELRVGLEAAFDSINTNGGSDIVPGERHTATRLANREARHRFLHFKDADSYIEYQREYGPGDLWSTLMGHVDGMSRSIAALEMFGSNADVAVKYLIDWAAREASKTTPNWDRKANQMEDYFRYLVGYQRGVSNIAIAKGMDNANNVLMSALLGGAVLSSIPDVGTITMTAAYNRISPMHVFINALLTANPFSKEGKAYLENVGLMTNSALMAMRRYQVDWLGGSFTSKLSNAVMQLQGMNVWTESWRGGFSATHARALGRLMQYHSMHDPNMHPQDVRILRGRGITDYDFAIWKLSELDNSPFGELLSVNGIYRLTDEELSTVPLPMSMIAVTSMELKRHAARSLLALLKAETEMAVIEPGAFDRYWAGAATSRGGLGGEMWRAGMSLKTFPMALFRKHYVQRGGLLGVAEGPPRLPPPGEAPPPGGHTGEGGFDTAGGKIFYMAATFVLMTMFGAVANVIYDISRGRDPRPLYGPDGKAVFLNWLAAVLKGGGLAVYGDFLADIATEDHKNAIADLAGPMASKAAEAGSLVLSNAVQSMGDRPTNWEAEAVKLLKGITPGQNLWWSKLATDQFLFVYLQDLLNPGYARRAAARAQREWGQGTYWPTPGQGPERAPNMGGIIGEPP